MSLNNKKMMAKTSENEFICVIPYYDFKKEIEWFRHMIQLRIKSSSSKHITRHLNKVLEIHKEIFGDFEK